MVIPAWGLVEISGFEIKRSHITLLVDRAVCACENTGNNVKMHFSGMTLKSQGRPGLDYKLSRFGGYLTAMNGDPRKPEIAAAQSYFAIKTHSAETRTSYQVQSSISQEAAQLALMLGEFAGLDKSLTAQLAINAAAAVNPALSPAVNELKSAIACTNTTDDAYLNPTQIGEVMGMSARAVNIWLLNSGLQYKTDDKKIPYRPTESGKQWGRMVPALAKGSNQTVFQLRWLPTVTELFNERN